MMMSTTETTPAMNGATVKRKSTDIHPTYPACVAGPELTINYTELVKPAVRVWTEKVTGFTALVAFQTSMSSFFVLLICSTAVKHRRTFFHFLK